LTRPTFYPTGAHLSKLPLLLLLLLLLLLTLELLLLMHCRSGCKLHLSTQKAHKGASVQ